MYFITEEKKKWYQRNENLLSRSQFPVPYLIRHNLLLNVSNFLHLWELSKITDKDYPQYQLTISAERYEPRKIENFKQRMPLIDEVALVVLFDLGKGIFGHSLSSKSYLLNKLSWISEMISSRFAPIIPSTR